METKGLPSSEIRAATCLAVALWFFPAAVTAAELADQAVDQAHEGLTATKTGKSNIIVKSWSKEELSERPVAGIKYFLDYLATEVSGFILSLADKDAPVSGKNGLMKICQDGQEISSEAHTYQLGTLRKVQARPQGNKLGLANYLRSQSATVAGDRISSALPLLSDFKQGFSFNLGLSGNSAPTTNEAKKPQRYGLVLQGIETIPSDNLRAMASHSLDDRIQFESQSKLIWTIGPVAEENRHVFHEEKPEFDSIESASKWSKFSLPSPDMRVKILPVSANPQDFLGKQLPAYVITVTQIENIYQLSYLSRDKDGKPKTSHTFAVPVAGTLNLVRVYDDRGHPLRAEANRILIYEGAPIVNLKYLDVEKVYTTESVCLIGDHTLTFGSERRLGVTDSTHPRATYNSSYGFRF